MMVIIRFVRILSVTFLGLSLVACAGDLETQIIEEAEQAAAEEESTSDNATTQDTGGETVAGSDDNDSSDATDSADPTDSTDTDTTEPESTEPKITNYPQDDGVTLTLANATNYESWVYFDFETQSQVFPENPVDSIEWDIAFMRYRVKLNGGFHGTGQVIARLIEDVTLVDVTEVPVDGWKSDGLDVDDDQDEFPEEPLSSWYEYESSTHTLSPYEQVYVIRSVESAFFKLEFAGYYNQDGVSGNPSIRWLILPEPVDGIDEPEIEEPGDFPESTDEDE